MADYLHSIILLILCIPILITFFDGINYALWEDFICTIIVYVVIAALAGLINWMVF